MNNNSSNNSSKDPDPTSHDTTNTKTDNADKIFQSWLVGSRYEIIRSLGSGSYGEVVEAFDKQCNRRVAIKRLLNIYSQQKTDVKRLYREIHILRNLDHPQIIQLEDVVCPYLDIKHMDHCSDSNVIDYNQNNITDSDVIYVEDETQCNDTLIRNKRKLVQDNYIDKKKLPNLNRSNSFESIDLQDVYLVFEYVDTDLFKLFNSNQYLTNEHIQTFAYQILVGLRYLHRVNVIHRDLKPANILINEDCSLKICDFGLSRVVSADYFNPSPNPIYHDMHSNKRSPDRGKCSPFRTKSSDSNFDNFDRRTLSRHNSNSSANVPFLELEKESSSLRRTLTKHVVTRYYRAPEIILLKDYTSKVDIWSVGCIFAELLGMQKDSVPHIDDRTALFPGDHCYPLSDGGKYDENGLLQPESDNERLDQLHVIFKLIGTPSDEDISKIKEKKVREMLSNMKKYEPKNLQKLFPGASSLAIDLLQSMLQFDPHRRISVDDALHHPYFRDLLPEYGFLENIQPMSDEIETSCEEDGNLRNCLISEIVSFREAAKYNMDMVDTDTELSLSTHSNQAFDF